jgi:hypothetical protein
MTERVYIHVGLPKTGTTYLQQCLSESREALAADGVLVPGRNHLFQTRAFWDLLGRRLRDVDGQGVAGAWGRLLDATTPWAGRSVVLSEEFLVNARKAHVKKVVQAFAPAEVHVVVTVRDLGRVLGSMWQQELSKGRTWTWAEFVAAVRDPGDGPATAGVAFWLRQDLARVLATWESEVPQERIHVVVVPPAGTPPERLLELFAEATDISPATVTPTTTRDNSSVGVVETELLRRLNEGLGDRLNERQYLYLVNRVLKPALHEQASGTSFRLPASERAWVTEKGRETVALLAGGGYHVVGDLEHLVPPLDDAPPGTDPGAIADSDLLAAALTGLTGTVESYGRYWWRTRTRRNAPAAGSAERAASGARALVYRAKVGLLERADHNRVLGWAARRYLAWRSRKG